MLVLLPPSEGKAASRSGRPLDLGGLSLPGLTPARERVLDRLVELCGRPDDEAARLVLGLSVGQRDEVVRNGRLRQSGTRPAGGVYTGVLYEALDLASLSPAASRLVRRSTLVFSGLWGAVRLTDRIPAYRCPVTVTLPGIGALGPYWKAALAPVLVEAAGTGLVLDLRSTAYQVMWRPAGPVADRTVVVRVLHEQVVAGVVTRSVVSHFNKATKGRLVRDLATAGAKPRSATSLVVALRDLGYTVHQPPRVAGRPHHLDVVVTEV